MNSIEILEECRQAHVEWAEYFEKYPHQETVDEYKHMGGAAFHRSWVEKYTFVIRELEALRLQAAVRGS